MFSQTIELRGHIIDSLILPKVLDGIQSGGAEFHIVEIKIGQKRVDQSYALIEVTAPSAETLSEMLLRLRQHGAEISPHTAISTSSGANNGGTTQ